jgi:rhodanese-related sulfurtransferase
MPSFRGSPIDAIIDVRTTLEFWLGHLDGAVHIPVQELPEALEGRAGITRDSRLVVYCASGGRSAHAAAALSAAGYTHVVDGGGMGDAKAHFPP